MREIPECDWKVFRDLHKVALDHLCEKILAQARAEIERPNKSAHERYLALSKLLQRRDEDIARGFNDFRRSTALAHIGTLHQMGLFTGEELERFSPETRQIIQFFSQGPGD